MANSRCFTVRSNIILPDPIKVLSNLNTGSAGRDLADAVFNGRVNEAAEMIGRDPKLLLTQAVFDPSMQSAPSGQYGDLLTFAVSRCDKDMMTLLLERGMPADGVQKGQALGLALQSDTPEMAEILFAAGASTDPQGDGMHAMMSDLFAFGNAGAVMALIRHGADVKTPDTRGDNLLWLALSMEQYEIAEIIADQGANLWMIDNGGGMPSRLLANISVLELSEVQAKAKARLIERAKKAGLPWPPPNPETIQNKVLDGTWPTPEQKQMGMDISPQAVRTMRERLGR